VPVEMGEVEANHVWPDWDNSNLQLSPDSGIESKQEFQSFCWLQRLCFQATGGCFHWRHRRPCVSKMLEKFYKVVTGCDRSS
jgi:hypothetical protein